MKLYLRTQIILLPWFGSIYDSLRLQLGSPDTPVEFKICLKQFLLSDIINSLAFSIDNWCRGVLKLHAMHLEFAVCNLGESKQKILDNIMEMLQKKIKVLVKI